MLELSTTSGYALLALGYLETSRNRWIMAREIAENIHVARPYLSHVLHQLVRAGIVKAKRGYRGGFCLARLGSQIAVLDIISAVERRSRGTCCLLGLSGCSNESDCPVHAMWKMARSQVESRLAGLTLDVIAGAISKRLPIVADQCGHRSGPSLDAKETSCQAAPLQPAAVARETSI